MLKFCFTTL